MIEKIPPILVGVEQASEFVQVDDSAKGRDWRTGGPKGGPAAAGDGGFSSEDGRRDAGGEARQARPQVQSSGGYLIDGLCLAGQGHHSGEPWP
jgi:hypothetical protein